MSIVKREFVWNDKNKRKTRYGVSGWLLTSMPNFDPCHRDYVVMHDTFEHQPDDKPDIEHEMMAFGALAFIRVKGMWDVFDSMNDALRSISEDVLQFMGEVKFVITECPDVKELNPDLQLIINTITRKYRDRYDSDDIAKHGDGLTKALYWLSKGYSRAQERWKGHTAEEVCRMLESTLAELKEVTGRLHYYNDENGKKHPRHGSKLTISFNTRTLKTVIKYVKNPKKDHIFA